MLGSQREKKREGRERERDTVKVVALRSREIQKDKAGVRPYKELRPQHVRPAPPDRSPLRREEDRDRRGGALELSLHAVQAAEKSHREQHKHKRISVVSE